MCNIYFLTSFNFWIYDNDRYISLGLIKEQTIMDVRLESSLTALAGRLMPSSHLMKSHTSRDTFKGSQQLSTASSIRAGTPSDEGAFTNRDKGADTPIDEGAITNRDEGADTPSGLYCMQKQTELAESAPEQLHDRLASAGIQSYWKDTSLNHIFTQTPNIGCSPAGMASVLNTPDAVISHVPTTDDLVSHEPTSDALESQVELTARYERDFDPREYHLTYYSQVDEEVKFFLDCHYDAMAASEQRVQQYCQCGTFSATALLLPVV